MVRRVVQVGQLSVVGAAWRADGRRESNARIGMRRKNMFE